MIVVRDRQSAHRIGNAAVRALILRRIDQLDGETFDEGVLGYFLVIDPGDTIEEINSQVSFNILHNRFTGVRYDQQGFARSFEFIEEFQACFNLVFVLDDSGAGVELFVPKGEGLHQELIAMCRRFAFKTEDEDAA